MKKKNVKKLIIAVIICIAVIGLVLYLSRSQGRSHDDDTGKKCTSKCTDRYNNEKILFLYPESGGFGVSDASFPSIDVVKKNFTMIITIANNSGNKEQDWEFIKNKYPDMKHEKWLAYYFGTSDETFGKCNYSNYDKKLCNVDAKNQIQDDIDKYQLSGIFFDDEVGDPKYIVRMMNCVQKDNPEIQLGWTKSLKNVTLSSPGNVGGCWQFSLGQAYTDMTTGLYNGSCKIDKDIWKKIKSKMSTNNRVKGVPLFCGAGNCVGDNEQCIDERMSQTNLDELINKKSSSPIKNMGIWYGTYSDNGVGFCSNSNKKKCSIGCCDDWN